MFWHCSHRADRRVLPLADRHYNRQKIGAPQFVPPGECLVFRTEANDAVWVSSCWVSSWPLAEYTQHAWAGAWVNNLFRNESPHLSSTLIIQALAATCYYWEPPPLGIISFVDPREVPGVARRGKKVFGYCYLKAGWKHVGFTKEGLWAWQLLPKGMPPPCSPQGVKKGFSSLFPRTRKARK